MTLEHLVAFGPDLGQVAYCRKNESFFYSTSIEFFCNLLQLPKSLSDLLVNSTRGYPQNDIFGWDLDIFALFSKNDIAVKKKEGKQAVVIDRRSNLSDEQLRQLWSAFEEANPAGFGEFVDASLDAREVVDGESSDSMVPIFLRLEAFSDGSMLELNQIAFDM